MMNDFKQWILLEGAKNIFDLKKDGMYIVIRIQDNISIEQAFSHPENAPHGIEIRLNKGNSSYGINGKFMGEVFLEMIIDPEDYEDQHAGIYASHSRVQPEANGYGPFLYDIALELARMVGHKVMPTQGAHHFTKTKGFKPYVGISNRGTTSDDAQNIWKYYANKRPDVAKYRGNIEHDPEKSFLYNQYVKKPDLVYKLSQENLIVDVKGQPIDFHVYA